MSNTVLSKAYITKQGRLMSEENENENEGLGIKAKTCMNSSAAFTL